MSLLQTCHVIWRFPKIGLPIVPPNHPAIIFGNLFPLIINHPAIKGYHHFRQPNKNWLVVSTPLKNMSSSVGSIIPNWMESHNPAMFQSPPTRKAHLVTSLRVDLACPRNGISWGHISADQVGSNLGGGRRGAGPKWENGKMGPLFEWPLEWRNESNPLGVGVPFFQAQIIPIYWNTWKRNRRNRPSTGRWK